MVRADGSYLLFTAFIAGMAVMVLEMSAARLIAPYFGTSIFVWANIIGVTMISLSAGYYLGGRAADKNPEPKTLFKAVAGTGLYSTLIPFIAPPLLKLSLTGVRTGSLGIFYGSLAATILFFAPPLTTLGGVAPFIIRLSNRELETTGVNTGKVFSISTMGSIIGTFLPVLLTIPLLGTKNTLMLLGVLLLVVGFIGLGRKNLASLAILLITASAFLGPVKPAEGTIYEKESVHNYIQVVEKNGITYLKLNEGFAYHSIYDPQSVLVGGVWDYFNILPILRPEGRKALIIGLAGGTIARQYRTFFPNISIDGVELDSEIINAGKTFFDMEGPNLSIYPMDGRAFLISTPEKYDYIIIDAYKQPYIPFHLTTKEFFAEVKRHLNVEGVVAINVASLGPDTAVLRMLQNTLASVYPDVHVVNPPGSLNYIVIASQKELSFNQTVREQSLEILMEEAARRQAKVSYDSSVLTLTDDRAPVEAYTDMMIYRYVRKEDTREYTLLFE